MRSTKVWRRFWILLLVPAGSAVLQAGLCATTNDIAGGDPTAPTVSVSVKLQNLETPVVGDNVHILAPGEEYSPFNRLTPGDFRHKSINMRRNEEVRFQAGRNGGNLPNGSVTCKCTTACPREGSTVGAPAVEWNGTRLSCVSW